PRGRLDLDAAHPRLRLAVPAAPARHARAAGTDRGREVPAADHRVPVQGAVDQEGIEEGLRGGNRTAEPRPRERDEEVRATQCAQQPAARTAGDVTADARGAKG